MCCPVQQQLRNLGPETPRHERSQAWFVPPSSAFPTRLTYKSGDRVEMSAARLRKQLMSSPDNTVLVVCYQAGGSEFVGHAFATSWDYEGGKVDSHLDQFQF